MAKILVVDDEVNVASELAEILEEESHSVDCAESAKEAIEKVGKNAYDIVFLDVLMPKMEGSEALTELQKISSVPVVIMSGYLAPDMEKQVLSAGAFACLKKPFKIKDVLQLVERATKRKK